MEAKVKDLLKAGMLLVKSVDLDRFVKVCISNGVFPKVGSRFNDGFIVMVEG